MKINLNELSTSKFWLAQFKYLITRDTKYAAATWYWYDWFTWFSAAQFGMDGRPFHHMFYAVIPHYYSLMHVSQPQTASPKH